MSAQDRLNIRRHSQLDLIKKDVFDGLKPDDTVDENHLKDHLQHIVDNHDLDSLTKETLVDQIKKLDQINNKNLSEMEQMVIDEEFRGKIDLKFLVKESQESDQEYGQEVYETLKNEAYHACNNFYEMTKLRRLTGSEPTFFM